MARLARARARYHQARRKQIDLMEAGAASIGTPDGLLALTRARLEMDSVDSALTEYQSALEAFSNYLGKRAYSGNFAPPEDDGIASDSSLTPREIEVLKLVASGLTTHQVALTLGIAFKTAACHRARILEKLDLHETASLVRYAVERGYVSTAGSPGPSSEIRKLHARVRSVGEEYRIAAQEYDEYLRASNTARGAPPTDVVLLKLRAAEQEKHQAYVAALRSMRAFLQERKGQTVSFFFAKSEESAGL
ncbi:MAG TPA: helix-turn-helix transcriptional regulator [Bryobacteraceae bacterium]